jgi:hypothetical protein
MRWERLAGLRSPALMLLAIIMLIGGVGTGAFLICVPAGWITVGILGFVSLAFLAWVTDPDAVNPQRAVIR